MLQVEGWRTPYTWPRYSLHYQQIPHIHKSNNHNEKFQSLENHQKGARIIIIGYK